jgi:hypothetical protein
MLRLIRPQSSLQQRNSLLLRSNPLQKRMLTRYPRVREIKKLHLLLMATWRRARNNPPKKQKRFRPKLTTVKTKVRGPFV